MMHQFVCFLPLQLRAANFRFCLRTWTPGSTSTKDSNGDWIMAPLFRCKRGYLWHPLLPAAKALLPFTKQGLVDNMPASAYSFYIFHLTCHPPNPPKSSRLRPCLDESKTRLDTKPCRSNRFTLRRNACESPEGSEPLFRLGTELNGRKGTKMEGDPC